MTNFPKHHVGLVVLLTVLISTSCSALGVFDPAIQMCCKSKISPRSFGSESACCGAKVHNASQSTCCVDEATGVATVVAHPILNSRRKHGRHPKYQCCGTGLYNPRKQTCCDGTPAAKTFKNSGCCNRKSYNADHFLCCGNSTLHSLSTPSMGKDGALSAQPLACCGDQSYDPKEFMCCDGKIHVNEGKVTACCGKEVLVVGLQGCCGGLVYDDPIGQVGCCGIDTYMRSDEICCDGVIMTNPLRQKACCGKQSYNVYQAVCCGGAVVLANNSANSTSAVSLACCSSAVVPKTRNGSNSTGSTCCGGAVVPKTNHSGNGTAVSSCCGGAVPKTNHSGNGTACCGKDHSCCHGAAASQSPLVGTDGTYACCRNVTYEPQLEICCGGKVHPRGSNDTQCCGVQPYEKDDATCCGNTLLPVTDNTLKCCRKRVVRIPKNKELCC